MKNFKVKKYLEEGKVVEYAVFEDEKKKKIHTDKNYGKYFYVENTLNNDTKAIFKRFFTGRITDAVQTIINGDGDCIKEENLFGSTIHVVYFLDRTIGEELRQKSIEGWKDTNFGWTIEFGCKNSFNPYSKINSKGNPLGWRDNHLSYITFSTEEEAEKQVNCYLENARKIATDLVIKNKNVSKKKNINEILNAFEEKGELFSIVCEFVFDLLNEDTTDFKNPEKELTNYGFKVVQCIIPKAEEIAKNELEIKAMNLSMDR